MVERAGKKTSRGIRTVFFSQLKKCLFFNKEKVCEKSLWLAVTVPSGERARACSGQLFRVFLM